MIFSQNGYAVIAHFVRNRRLEGKPPYIIASIKEFLSVDLSQKINKILRQVRSKFHILPR